MLFHLSAVSCFLAIRFPAIFMRPDIKILISPLQIYFFELIQTDMKMRIVHVLDQEKTILDIIYPFHILCE